MTRAKGKDQTQKATYSPIHFYENMGKGRSTGIKKKSVVARN